MAQLRILITKAYFILLTVIGLWVTTFTPAFAQISNIRFERDIQNLEFTSPIAMAPISPHNSWLVAEQRGVIWEIGSESGQINVFADFRSFIEDGPSEAGLLGMALHPKFDQNGKVILSYTQRGNPLTSIIAEFTAFENENKLNPQSQKVILSLEQPYSNHNGGHIAFGPDGYLYIGFGDGGAGGDPLNHGQNPNTLHGSLLRLDIDVETQYAIPNDNPFKNGEGRAEIYAIGLRNPWRFTFDKLTGELWLADVGQRKWEEINIIQSGANYGWNVREGGHCYGLPICKNLGLEDPIGEYSHSEGCSITGGYVYRGELIPSLRGKYIYGDYCNGKIWVISKDSEPTLVLDTDFFISSFAEGADQEIYVLDHRGGGIYRLISE